MPTPFGLRTLRQISMNAKDLDRATAFYRDTLGVPFLFQVPNMSFFDLDGVRLLVGLAEDAAHDHPGSVLYFSVPDMDAAHAALTERGVAFNGEPHFVADMGDHDLWMGFFKDSEGNQLALLEERAKVS